MIKIKAKEALDVHKHIWDCVIKMIEKDEYYNTFPQSIGIHDFKKIACLDLRLDLICDCVGCASLIPGKDCEDCILNLGECKDFRAMDYYYYDLDKHLLIKLAKKIRDCGLRPGIDPEQIVHLRESGDKKCQ